MNLLQKIGRVLVLYAGASYVSDKLVRPQYALHKAKLAAKRLDGPLLVVGYGLDGALGDKSIDLEATPETPWDLPADSASVVLLLNCLAHIEDPLSVAIEAERVLCEGGEILVMSSSPFTLHAWFGPKWVLFNVGDGKKQALKTPLYKLTRAKIAATADTPLSAATTPPPSADADKSTASI